MQIKSEFLCFADLQFPLDSFLGFLFVCLLLFYSLAFLIAAITLSCGVVRTSGILCSGFLVFCFF